MKQKIIVNIEGEFKNDTILEDFVRDIEDKMTNMQHGDFRDQNLSWEITGEKI